MTRLAPLCEVPVENIAERAYVRLIEEGYRLDSFGYLPPANETIEPDIDDTVDQNPEPKESLPDYQQQLADLHRRFGPQNVRDIAIPPSQMSDDLTAYNRAFMIKPLTAEELLATAEHSPLGSADKLPFVSSAEAESHHYHYRRVLGLQAIKQTKLF